MRGSRSGYALLLWTALALGMPAAIGAQSLFGDVGRPIRLEGYWDRTERDPGVLEEIIVSLDGRTRRPFGVTALQAYRPAEEGIHVLRHSGLQPITLLLRGRDEMMERFARARGNERVTAYGVYRAASGTLTLDSIEIAEATSR